jgi:hypothetical protein
MEGYMNDWKPRGVCALLFMASLAVAGCQTAAEAPSTAHITDQQAFAAARSAVLANLKDPDSAKFGASFTRKRVSMINPLFVLRGYTVDQRTDIVCGTVNSRNSFGGYVGQSVFAYRIGHKDVFIDESIRGGERTGSIWCVDSSDA